MGEKENSTPKPWKSFLIDTAATHPFFVLVAVLGCCLFPFLALTGTLNQNDVFTESVPGPRLFGLTPKRNESTEVTIEEPPFCKLVTDRKLLAHYSDEGVDENAKAKPELRYQMHYKGNETFATFCHGGYNPIGIGNALSIYWATRAVAFFEGCTFVLPDKKAKRVNETHYCNRPILKVFNPIYPKSSPKWMWYVATLDRSTLFSEASGCHGVDDTENRCMADNKVGTGMVRVHKNRTNSDSLLTTVSVSDALKKIQRYFRWIYSEGKRDWALPYHCRLILLQYNPYYMPTVRRQTMAALSRFSKATGERMPTTHLPDGNTLKVVIHVRCGDTLVGANSRRVIMSLRYYQLAADFIWRKQPQHIQQWLMENPSDVHVEIVSQLDVSNAHLQADIDGIEECTQIVGFMADTFRTDLFVNLKPNNYGEHFNRTVNLTSSVVIRGNSSANADYYRMVTATNLINSGSSFSLNAAFAADPNSILVFPTKGPWEQIGQLLQNQSRVFDNHLWVAVGGKTKMSTQAHKFWHKGENFVQWFPAN